MLRHTLRQMLYIAFSTVNALTASYVSHGCHVLSSCTPILCWHLKYALMVHFILKPENTL